MLGSFIFFQLRTNICNGQQASGGPLICRQNTIDQRSPTVGAQDRKEVKEKKSNVKQILNIIQHVSSIFVSVRRRDWSSSV